MRAMLLLPIIAFAGSAQAADVAHPAVIELYQSQGCASCPPANAVLNAIADRPDLIALNFSVTYWDQLGWKDSFGQAAFTARQWDYAKGGGRTQVYTPQIIVNGRYALVGSRQADVEAALARFDRGTDEPMIALANGKVSVSAGHPGKEAIVWAVRYDPRTIDVAIRAGENDGRTLPHRNIVRQLVEIGRWHGPMASYAVPPGVAGLETAILIQAGRGGPIIAARRG